MIVGATTTGCRNVSFDWKEYAESKSGGPNGTISWEHNGRNQGVRQLIHVEACIELVRINKRN